MSSASHWKLSPVQLGAEDVRTMKRMQILLMTLTNILPYANLCSVQILKCAPRFLPKICTMQWTACHTLGASVDSPLSIVA